MKYISLFAGIGGFDLALNRLGHECVYANEWDKYAAQIYEKNFKQKPDTKDIRAVDASTIPDFDLLCGGFPCQAFSIAGKRGGFQDTRGTLFYEIARIVEIKRPAYLFLENVKGLLNHDNGRTFETIMRAINELGYDAQWQVCNSKDFGVPQNRERVFIIANLRGQSRPEVFPIGSDAETGNKKSNGKTQDATNTIQAGYGKAHGGDSYVVAPTIRATEYKHGDNQTVILQKSPDYRKDGILREFTKYSPTIRAEMGDNHPMVASCAIRTRTYIGQPAQLEVRKDNISNTIDQVQKDYMVTNGMAIRRLTPTECERLQGFPSLLDWTNGQPFGNIGDMTRDELISIALAINTIKVDPKTGKVFVLRGPGGIELKEPRECGTECNGYLVANLSANGVKKQVRLHRVVWISQYGIPPSDRVVCHRDNNKKNNAIDNLYLDTHEENTRDASRDGLLDGRGAKIDFEIANYIRMDYATEKFTMRQLAEKYKISKSRIHQVIRMQGWTEGVSDTQRYKCLGNAVTVNTVYEIAKRAFH